MNQPALILHLEDNPRAAELVIAQLEQGAGPCQVRQVSQRAAYEAALQESPFDLILVVSPVPGREALSALDTARQTQPDVPCIVVAGVLDAEATVECFVRGATDCVFTDRLERLGPAVARALAGAGERQQRLAAEAALRVSERLFRSLVISSSQTVWSLRPGGVPLEQVDKVSAIWWCALTGQTEAERVGDNHLGWLAVVHEDDREMIQDFWAALPGTSEPTMLQFRIRRADGAWRWLESKSVPLRDAAGAVTEWAGTLSDITERREAEEERDQIFNLSLDLICVAGFDGYFKRLNPAWTATLGWTLAELLARPWLDFIHPDDQAASLQVKAELVNNHPLLSFENRYRHRDGSYRWFSWKAYPLAAEQKSFAIARDVTARKQAEAEHRQLEAQIRQANKMEAIGTLAGGIAHDFNNILGAILGNAALARQDVGPNHAARDSLDEILKAGQRAKELVQKILAFSRQETPAKRLLDLRSAVEEDVGLLRATLPAGVELIAHCAAEVPSVLADPPEIHQVLLNLCTNAWHAMAGRPGRITLRLDALMVDAILAGTHADLRPGYYARLTVTDTGKGMDAATVERIFDPFFTTKSIGQGTGLGLSMVHGIIKHHHGAILVTSQPGEGASFELYFPAATGAGPVEATSAVSGQWPRGQGQHILVLDDEEALVILIRRLLGRLGYRVTGFTRAAEALTAFRANPGGFDLIVTDFNMPGISGLDVAREVAALRPELPVMIASGYLTEDLRAQAAAVGVKHLLYKPNTVEELCETVHRLLQAAKPPD